MPDFGINLDLNVRGQEKFQRAIKGVEALEAAAKRVKKEFDLSGKLPGTQAQADRIGSLKAELTKLAQKLTTTGTSGRKTQAGVNDLVSTFKSLSAASDVTKVSFDQFVKATVVAEREVNKLARAEENVRREFLGMQSLESREAQLERRGNKLRFLRTQRKLKLQEADARKENAKQIDREARSLERKNDKAKREAAIAKRTKARQGRQKFTDVATGIGFPLLFGGGPGSAIGGAIGGALGGLGGSVLASALGQQIDKLGGFAIKTGAALDQPIEQFEEIIKLTGSLGREIGGQQGLLKSLGLTEVAALQASQTFEEAYGLKTVNSLKDLSRSAVAFQDAMARLGITITATLAGPLGDLLNSLSRVMPKGRIDEISERQVQIRQRTQQLEIDLKGGINPKALSLAERLKLEKQGKPVPDVNTFAGASSMSLSRRTRLQSKLNELNSEMAILEKERTRLIDEQNNSLTSQSKITGIIRDQIKAIAEIDKRRTQQEQMRFTARRDTLATFSANTEIKQAENSLNSINLRLKAVKELNKETIKNGKTDFKNFDKQVLLEKEQTAAQENLNRLRAKGSNDELVAKRAINKDELQAINNIKKTTILRQQSHLEELTFNKGREAIFEGELLVLEQNFKLKEQIALSQNKQSLESVKELEIKKQLVQLHAQEADLRKRNFDEAVRITKESQAQFRIAKAEREQQAASRLKESQNKFGLDMRQSQITPVGFFTESQKSIDIRELETALILEQKSLKIANMRKNLKENGADLREDEKINRQFAIDQAAKLFDQDQKNLTQLNEQLDFQDRYRDALALTTPVVDSLFDSLTAVVAGTKSAEEAFADFLRTISDMLMDTVKQMIAQYIALAIARSFGMGGKGEQPGFDLGGFGNLSSSGVGFLEGANIPLLSRANGGPLSANQPSIIGERGPELFIPFQSGRVVSNEMSRASSSQVPFTRNVERVTQAQETAAAMQNAGPIDVRYESQVINNVEYVTAEEYRQGMTQAAERGKALTLSALQNRPAIRAQVGIR